ncbi:hypothetical protein [Halovulum sp. GXIMD14793]
MVDTIKPSITPSERGNRTDTVFQYKKQDQRFRVLCIVNDCTREALATVVDRSLSGARMTRE